MNKWQRAQGDRNRNEQRVGEGREIPRGAALRATGRAAFSSAHERCDCLTTSPSQESSPSSGQRPLYLPGLQGHWEKPRAGYVRYHAGAGGGEREGCGVKKLLFNVCYKYFRGAHTLWGDTRHTHTHTGGQRGPKWGCRPEASEWKKGQLSMCLF